MEDVQKLWVCLVCCGRRKKRPTKLVSKLAIFTFSIVFRGRRAKVVFFDGFLWKTRQKTRISLPFCGSLSLHWEDFFFGIFSFICSVCHKNTGTIACSVSSSTKTWWKLLSPVRLPQLINKHKNLAASWERARADRSKLLINCLLQTASTHDDRKPCHKVSWDLSDLCQIPIETRLWKSLGPANNIRRNVELDCTGMFSCVTVSIEAQALIVKHDGCSSCLDGFSKPWRSTGPDAETFHKPLQTSESYQWCGHARPKKGIGSRTQSLIPAPLIYNVDALCWHQEGIDIFFFNLLQLCSRGAGGQSDRSYQH